MRSKKEVGTYEPLIKWVGGKRKLLPILTMSFNEATKNIEDKNISYYEPFFGGGALFFELISKSKIKKAYINDTIPHLISFYETLKEEKNIDPVIKNLLSMEKEFNLQNNKTEREKVYNGWKKEFNYIWKDKNKINKSEKVKSASLFLALNKAGFNGMFRLNNKGEFNIPIGDTIQLKITNKEPLARTSKALKDVEANCGSYEEILPPNKKIDPKTSFIYLDPPYIPNSKSASFTDYSKEGFKEEDHIKLAEVFQGLVDGGYKVLLSNNNNKEAIEKYVKGTKNTFAYEVMVARNIAPTQNNTRPKVSEIMVSSFNLDNLGLSRVE